MCLLASCASLATAQDTASQLASFDRAWTIVKERHWDATLGGVDWDAVKTELRPQAEQAATSEQTRKVIQAMIAKLGVSHFSVVPKQAYEATSIGSGQGETGITLRVVDGNALVTEITPASPADKAGVKPGWTLLEFRGKNLNDTLKLAAMRAPDERRKPIYQSLVANGAMHGKPGEVAKAVFENGSGKQIASDLGFAEPRGTMTTFGNLPPTPMWFESKKLPGKIGYFRLSIFLDPERVLNAFADAVKSCTDCKGFVIDLRGNPGGIGAMAMGMSGWFLEEEKPLGEMITRTNKMRFAVNPRVGAFTGKLAVLIDGLSMSTSEILAGGLQDLKRARVFGERSGGAALPSQFEVLPNGDRFQFAFANYVSAGGKTLEANGVTPDVEVRPDRAALLAGRDPVLEAASQWILEEKR
jgi:carboxyl-terminal processing protease